MNSKQIKKLASGAVLCALCFVGICLSPRASQSKSAVKILPGNLVKNPGFEEYTAETIPGWTEVARTEEHVIEIDPTVSHTGKSSLKLAWLTDLGRITFYAEQKIKFEPNHQYRLSVWIKKSRPNQRFDMRFRMYDGEKKLVFRTSPWWRSDDKSSTDPTDWQELVCENIIFVEDVQYMSLYIDFGRGKGTVWVDDVRFTRMEDDTFPLTDLSQYKPRAKHPMLWDPAPSLAKIAQDENAEVIDGYGRLKPLDDIRKSAERFLVPDWSSQGDFGKVNHYKSAEPVSYLSHLYVLTGEDKYLLKVKHELLTWAKNLRSGRQECPRIYVLAPCRHREPIA